MSAWRELREITLLRQAVEERKLDRINGRMKRLNRDPDRWVDSDMCRDEWLLLAKHYAILSVVITALVIIIGVWGPW